MIKYYFTRFVGLHGPGDEVPRDTYDQAQIDRWLFKHLIRKEDEAPAPAEMKRKSKKAAAKK